MSYPYGGGGGYPAPGGGYPGQTPGYPGGYPQPGGSPYGQPTVGMPTPESASAAAYGAPGGGLPYGTAPPGGAPGNLGFGGVPAGPGYPQAGGGYQQPNMGGYGAPGYNPPNTGYNPPAAGYNPPAAGYNPPAAGYGQPYPGAATGYQQAGYNQPGAPPSTSTPGYPQQGYNQAGASAPGYGQPSAPGYGQPSAPGYGQPSAPGYGQPSAPAYAPGGMSYASNVVPGTNVTALGVGGAHTGYKVREDPTLRPAANFNAENDAKILRKAMKGFGTDEKAIIDVLAYRTNAQRIQIKNMYKTCFGKDLVADLKSELGGHFEDAIIALTMTESEYDAYELKRAMRGIGTDEDAMIEILCSRNNRQIQEINAAYQRMYRTRLEQDIVNDTSGHFKRLMVSMSTGNRMENQAVDMNKANADAQSLYQAGEKRWGTDESAFNAILASQSYEQLRAVFDAYGRISGRQIEQALKGEMSGNLEIGMVAIVKCVRSKPAYFAEKLYKSMKGAGTDDRTLIRIIVTRAEVDMVQIKQEFQRLYNQPLEQFIRGDISGDYRLAMLALVGGGGY
ncbi:annexin A4-like isoform X2 [Dreissena polymorpha]|uniref:annexin A4-like isoform X2 n=1 Tax=Dreissena polymorpha TaxID=45954 RepID=UPI002264E4DA|nr:annexin A4-like isoform X2 [Dreissena polymorpha]